MHIKNLKLTILLTFLFLVTKAQTSKELATINGIVLNEKNLPLEFSNIILFAAVDSSMIKGTSTNKNGQFTIKQVKDGTYWISARYIGLTTVNLPVFEIRNGEDEKGLTIRFEQAPLDIAEVEVVASRPLIEVKPDRVIFNVDGSINAVGNTALELLSKSPGVLVDKNDNIYLEGKQGVIVYIDDKPSYLGIEEMAAYLKNLQSSEIDLIEIIAEPSAKYDAEGNAGIINIKTKKLANFGTNVNLNLGYSNSKNHKYNGGLNMNYRNDNFSLNGNVNYKNNKNERWFDFLTDQSDEIFNSEDTIFNDNDTYNYKVGIDYFVNKQNTIGILVSADNTNGFTESKSNTHISSEIDAPLKKVLISSSLNNRKTNSLNTNLNYQYKNNNSTEVNIDINYGSFSLSSDNKQYNQYETPSQSILSESNYAADSSTDINIYTAKTDFEKEVLHGRLETGVKFSRVATQNTYNAYKVFDVPELDKNRSSIFNFKENINAAYFNYKHSIEQFKLSTNIGLRIEQTNNTGMLIMQDNTEDSVTKRNYIDVFPAFGVSFQKNTNNQFKINYSKRIKRPRYKDLNPFEFILSELSFVKGNINLQPQYAHNLSLAHTYKNTLTTKLSYTYVNKYFDYLRDTIDVNKSFLQPVNLDNQQIINIGINYPYSLKNWWNTYTSLNAFRKYNNANFGENRQIALVVNSLSIYHQSTFLLPFDFSMEVSGYYNSPSIWGALYKSKSNCSIDIGLMRKLFNGKGNLKIAYTDVFNTSPWSAIQEFSGSKVEAKGGWESQRIQLNFTYLFGNEQVKDTRKRKTGIESEAERLK